MGEFVRIVTHRRIFDPPSSMEDALGALDALGTAPGLRILSPERRYAALFAEAVRVGRATGNLAFDAQIAAVCREHGVGRFLTRDQDFNRFPWIDVVDLDEDPAGLA